MKKIGWLTLLLFAIAFLMTLIVTAPATLFSTIAETASKGKFVLANTSGTVWQGSATPAIRQNAGGLLALERLNWNISVLPLFTGKIIIQLRWDKVAQAQPMMLVISFNQIELSNAILPLDAGVLGELSPFLQPVQLSGQMLFRSEHFIVNRQGMKGAAIADWTNAGSVLSVVKPLGHYRMSLAGSGDRLDISLVTLTGPLLLDGKGSLAGNRGINFKLTARASEDSKGSLDEFLNNFGPESAPGVHTLNLSQ